MRCWGISLFVWSLVILGAEPARAGIYNPGESEETATYPDFINSPQGKNFRDVIFVLRSIPVTQEQMDDPLRPQIDNPVRRRYAFLHELITLSGPGKVKTTEDLLMGSAVLIRRHKFHEAEQLLRPLALATGEQDNIPIQSNFATALHRGGDPKGAYETLRPVVLDHWKKSWGELSEKRVRELQRIGWSEPVYDLNRIYDTYYLKLLRLRWRERMSKKESKATVQLPDALFDDKKDPPSPVRFVGEGGEFEPGKLAAAERAKLPKEALAIVQQLIVWMPDDLRLYWLLGEMYNAQGGKQGILAARQIFLELQDHAVKSKDPLVSDDVKQKLGERVEVLSRAKEEIDRQEAKAFDDNFNKIVKTNEDFAVDWRTVAISFAVGFVLAFFVFWQVREIQRRRLARGIAK